MKSRDSTYCPGFSVLCYGCVLVRWIVQRGYSWFLVNLEFSQHGICDE